MFHNCLNATFLLYTSKIPFEMSTRHCSTINELVTLSMRKCTEVKVDAGLYSKSQLK